MQVVRLGYGVVGQYLKRCLTAPPWHRNLSNSGFDAVIHACCFDRFLAFSCGSLWKCSVYVCVCCNLKYISIEDYMCKMSSANVQNETPTEVWSLKKCQSYVSFSSRLHSNHVHMYMLRQNLKVAFTSVATDLWKKFIAPSGLFGHREIFSSRNIQKFLYCQGTSCLQTYELNAVSRCILPLSSLCPSDTSEPTEAKACNRLSVSSISPDISLGRAMRADTDHFLFL